MCGHEDELSVEKKKTQEARQSCSVSFLCLSLYVQPFTLMDCSLNHCESNQVSIFSLFMVHCYSMIFMQIGGAVLI